MISPPPPKKSHFFDCLIMKKVVQMRFANSAPSPPGGVGGGVLGGECGGRGEGSVGGARGGECYRPKMIYPSEQNKIPTTFSLPLE